MLKLSREVALFAVGGAPGLLADAVVVQVLVNFPGPRRWPTLAVAAGSAIAALVNFSTARGMLFKRSRTVT
jgi:putative flippase GtrA